MKITGDLLPAGWVSAIRDWAADTPEVVAVIAFGSRVSGVRREKADRSAIPDLDLAIQTIDNEFGNALGHFVCLKSEWTTDLEQRLGGVKVDLKHYDPSDAEDEVGPYFAVGEARLWP